MVIKGNHSIAGFIQGKYVLMELDHGAFVPLITIISIRPEWLSGCVPWFLVWVA